MHGGDASATRVPANLRGAGISGSYHGMQEVQAVVVAKRKAAIRPGSPPIPRRRWGRRTVASVDQELLDSVHTKKTGSGQEDVQPKKREKGATEEAWRCHSSPENEVSAGCSGGLASSTTSSRVALTRRMERRNDEEGEGIKKGTPVRQFVLALVRTDVREINGALGEFLPGLTWPDMWVPSVSEMKRERKVPVWDMLDGPWAETWAGLLGSPRSFIHFYFCFIFSFSIFNI